MRNKKVLFITQGAVIAAIYVVLTYIVSLLGLTNGVIQVRLSEALTILPVFTPAAIPGLVVGCVISNILTGAVIWDVIFGSLATLIGAVGTYLLRKHHRILYPPSAHNCQYCYSTACTDLCLRCTGRIMVLGTDGMCR